MNDNLPFVIPSAQSTKATKSGGKGYTYFGNPADFTTHKQRRTKEMQEITKEVKAEKPKIPNPEQLSFLDIELDPKATAKSSIPVELFDDYGLDVNKRLDTNELVISGTDEALEKFEKAMTTFEYVPQENDDGNFKNKEAALLSAITKISRVSKEKKLDGIIEDENLGVAYFYKSISEVNAKKIAKDLIETRGIKAKYMVSPSGAKILTGEFSADDVDLIINDDFENPFAKFEVMHHIGVVTKSINTTYPITKADIDISGAKTVVGIVDGGIAELDVLKDLVVGHKDYTSNPNSDKHHGTLAASRTIFGNDIEDQLFDNNKLVAHAKVVDIKVMEGDDGPTEVDLISYLEDAIKSFPDVKQYSMSLGLTDLCSHNKKSYLTRELDALQQNYGVVFVVSAGNRDDFHTRQYPDVLLEPESCLNSPGDLTNGLSVGALADKANKDSLAQINEPSPFTRTGFDGIRKPDLVHYGGNSRSSGIWRDQGVKGLSVVENELYENVGTSFATPVVSGELAQALAVIDESGYNNAVDLAKALTVHSASYIPNETSSINPKDLDKIVGHGVPDVSNVLFADKTKVVYVITGEIGGIPPRSKTREAVRNISFTIPNELKSLKRQLNVRATLAYTAPIDPNDEVDTAQSDVTMTLYKVNSRKKLVNSGKADDSDFSYKPKWYTVKCLERTYSSRSYDGGEWELRLTLQTRGDADDDSFMQPFALVVSIEDIGDGDGRVDLQQIIKTSHKQYIRISEIRNRQRATTN
ncbi:MAG TPA: S8 family peptidase [Candidatus Saccharimonadales bacterium]|nr:S8 family peptidase [Candidatus Saccharimonadales bacterium]